MTIREFGNRYQVVLVLSAIVMTLGIIKLTYRYEGPKEENKVQITPTTKVIPTTPEPTSAVTGEEYPLWKYIPYEEETFKVERYSQPLTLVIRLKSGEKSAAYEKVIKWMEGLKVEIKAHKITWE